MSSRCALAAQLLGEGEFEIAKQMLEKEVGDAQALYLLSLLYRYDDEYDKELGAIKSALEIDGSNTYMQDRLAWHNLPLFDRVVPRQPLHLPRAPKTIPSIEILENMSFVTGADSGYFTFLIQLIESIKNTYLYAHIPIAILDCGLTDDEKEILNDRFGITNIKKAEWKIVPGKQMNICGKIVETRDGYKAIMNKPFLFDYFDGFEYLVWMDADTWVQDERFFDTLLTYTVKYGVGVTSFNNHNNVATTAYAIKKDSLVVEFWKKAYYQILERQGFDYGGEEFSLLHAIRHLGITECFLPAHHICRIWIEGIPYVLGKNPTLYIPRTNTPLEIYGFDAYTVKSLFFWPLPQRNKGIHDEEEFKNHMDKSYWLRHQQDKEDFIQLGPFEAHTVGSLQYRTWPWRDKEEIKGQLLKAIDRCTQ